ncbi:YIP1 family protein [Paenirhodobacter sp.]|uniref:YIP1 family protein n=1 Tax=Paenirhodobacter sp. TaxID=1965326 RepID=UPI003B50BFDE
MDFAFLRALIFGSLRDPQGAARAILALDLPASARWIAFGAVICLSAALGTGAEILFAFITKQDLGTPTPPLPMALMQAGLILYGAWAVGFFGRKMGGAGRFADALVLIVWLEFMLILGQCVQLLIMVFFPLISVVGTLGLVLLLFWLLINFTAALHGFSNIAKVGAAVIVIFLGSGILAGTLLMSLGVVVVPAQM